MKYEMTLYSTIYAFFWISYFMKYDIKIEIKPPGGTKLECGLWAGRREKW